MVGVLLAGITLSMAGCGGGGARTLTLATYAAGSPEGEKAWRGLMPGARYMIYAPPGSCDISSAASLSELEKGGGQALAGSPAGTQLQVVQITDAWIRSGSDAFAALQVRNDAGQSFYLKLPAGRAQSCLQPVPDELLEARKLVGQKRVFAPWSKDCTEIQAVGRAPAAMLVDSEGDFVFELGELSAGPASARAMAEGKSGARIWLSTSNGALKLRADTVARCFAEPGTAARPSDPTALLRISPERCETSDDEGRRHVECRTTLGVWQGVSSDGALELRALRRSLGPAHFLEGRLVSGARYARTVVSVDLGVSADSRRQRVYAALTPAMRAAMAKDGGSVRVSALGAPDVTYQIRVELGEINIGELSVSEQRLTSRYKVRDDIQPNPEKATARDRVSSARDRVREAETEYQDRKQDFNARKKELVDQCNEAAASAEGWAKIAGQTGCSAADALIQPSDSELRSARQDLSNAESKLASTSETITVPIMADHPYTKKVFSRRVATTLSISLKPANAPAPRVLSTPLAYTWEDHEVMADREHNVEGHSPDRGPIDNPDALVPYIAKAASEAITTRFRAAISDAQIEAARRAMAEAGLEAAKPGFETVDALAYDAVGRRLLKPLVRGSSDLIPDKPLELPADALALGQSQCLLAVAAGAGDVALSLRLMTKGGSHGDLREAGFAIVEVCPSELPSAKLAPLLIASKVAGGVKWTLYGTSESKGVGQ